MLGKELIDDLLAVADELARVRSDRVGMQEARRRRAISGAYYAVLHALSSLCVETLVGWEAGAETIDLVYRSLDHRATRNRLTQRSSADLHPDIAAIGTAFARLLDKREAADYAHGRVTHAAEAIELIGVARDAIETIGRLDDRTRLRIATLLVVKPRMVPSS